MTEINKIKNIEDLKKVQIVCRNQEQVKDCYNHLEQLGFKVSYYSREGFFFIIRYNDELSGFSNYGTMAGDKYIEFYNKELVKTLQKFIKEKEKKEKKQELQDFECDENGRIIKINNYESKEIVYYFDTEKGTLINKNRICHFYESVLNLFISCGYVFDNKEALDNYIKYLIIRTKLKNLANRLNNGVKIDWEDDTQIKYCIFYDFKNDHLNCWSYGHSKDIGQIHCLDENFLEVAKQEIGEEDLKRYLQQSY